MFKFYIVVLWIKIKKLFKLCLLLNKYLKYLNILFIIWINPMDAKNYLDLLISSLITDEPKAIMDEPKAITDEPKAITDEPKAITDEPNEKYEKYRAISEAILVVSLMIIVIWAAYNIYNITGGGQNWGVGWGGAGVAGNAVNAGVDIDINIDTDSVGSDIDPGSLLSKDYQGIGADTDTDNNS